MARGRAGGRPRSGRLSCGSASRGSTPARCKIELSCPEHRGPRGPQARAEASDPTGDFMMTTFDVDLFVIGAGSGGVRAARVAAGYGARVMIAEEYRVGGTCVIRGCVPKKLLVYASRYADDFEEAGGFGWSVSEPRFDWPTL